MGLLETKEISATHEGKPSTHRVGPLAGMCAVIFWGAAFAFIISTVAFSTSYWSKNGPNHKGLWRVCTKQNYYYGRGEVVCVNMKGAQGWFKTVQSLVTLSFTASFASAVLAIIYTFVHTINKSYVLLLIISSSSAAGTFMISGGTYFVAKIDDHLGASFYLGGVAVLTDIVVAIVANQQKKKSEA